MVKARKSYSFIKAVPGVSCVTAHPGGYVWIDNPSPAFMTAATIVAKIVGRAK